MIGTSKYRVLHYRVARMKGTPSVCEFCGTTDGKIYDWANVDRKYSQDLNDYIRLCRSCHIRFDKRLKDRCHRGHRYTLENTYTNPRGFRSCRICRKLSARKYINKKGVEKIKEYHREYLRNWRMTKRRVN